MIFTFRKSAALQARYTIRTVALKVLRNGSLTIHHLLRSYMYSLLTAPSSAHILTF